MVKQVSCDEQIVVSVTAYPQRITPFYVIWPLRPRRIHRIAYIAVFQEKRSLVFYLT